MKLLDKYKNMSDGDVAAMWAFGSMFMNVIMACYNVYIWYFSKTYLFLVMCFYYMFLAIMRFFAAFTVHLFFKKPFNDFIKIILQVCGALMVLLGLILLIVVLSRAGHPTVLLDNWMAWGYGVLAVGKSAMVINGSRNARKYQDVLYSLVQRIGLVETTLTIYTFFQAVIYTYSLGDSGFLEWLSLVIGVIAVSIVMLNGIQTFRYDPRYTDASSGILFRQKGKVDKAQVKADKAEKKKAREGMVINPWAGDGIIVDRSARVDWTRGLEDQFTDKTQENPS